jgi:hypothetical protein
MQVAKGVIVDLAHLLEGLLHQVLGGAELKLNLGPTLADPTVACDLDIYDTLGHKFSMI